MASPAPADFASADLVDGLLRLSEEKPRVLYELAFEAGTLHCQTPRVGGDASVRQPLDSSALKANLSLMHDSRCSE